MYAGDSVQCAHQALLGMSPLTLSIDARKDGAVPCPRRSDPLAIPSCKHSPHLVSAHLCHLLTGHLLLLMLLLQLLCFSSSHPHLLACSKRCSVLLLLLVLVLLCCQLSQHTRPWHQTVVRCRAWHAIWRAAEEGCYIGVLSSQGPAKQRQLVDENSNTWLHTRGIAR